MTISPPPERLWLSRITTPIGVALIVVDDTETLRVFDWVEREALIRRRLAQRFPRIMTEEARPPQVAAVFAAYFDGDHAALRKARMATSGTAFQERVWSELARVRAGETISYATLAERAGRSGAWRAAGLANALNPIALAIPCHRVIGASGHLTGYAGGLDRKRWLLRHEGALA
jgi:methylated-DNA-[protein]-cysteine S-methyltransferase